MAFHEEFDQIKIFWSGWATTCPKDEDIDPLALYKKFIDQEDVNQRLKYCDWYPLLQAIQVIEDNIYGLCRKKSINTDWWPYFMKNNRVEVNTNVTTKNNTNWKLVQNHIVADKKKRHIAVKRLLKQLTKSQKKGTNTNVITVELKQHSKNTKENQPLDGQVPQKTQTPSASKYQATNFPSKEKDSEIDRLTTLPTGPLGKRKQENIFTFTQSQKEFAELLYAQGLRVSVIQQIIQDHHIYEVKQLVDLSIKDLPSNILPGAKAILKMLSKQYKAAKEEEIHHTNGPTLSKHTIEHNIDEHYTQTLQQNNNNTTAPEKQMKQIMSDQITGEETEKAVTPERNTIEMASDSVTEKKHSNDTKYQKIFKQLQVMEIDISSSETTSQVKQMVDKKKDIGHIIDELTAPIQKRGRKSKPRQTVGTRKKKTVKLIG